MGIWKGQPVATQPNLTLQQWRVFELANGDRHLAGWCVENREGRASTAIQTIDMVKLLAVTRSGRCYRLAGAPGFNSDGMYTWGMWKRVNTVESEKDVSDDVYAEHLAAALHASELAKA